MSLLPWLMLQSRPSSGHGHLSSGEPPGHPQRSPRLTPHPHDWMVRSSHSFHGNSCLHAPGRQEDTRVTMDHSYGHPGTQRVGDPRRKTREMMGKDVSAGFSREKSRPFPCTQLGALGVPRSGGLRPDLRLTNTSASLWKTLVRPWANGRLRPCHVCQQPAGGGFSRDISQPRDDTS